jgi:hypothetical protein
MTNITLIGAGKPVGTRQETLEEAIKRIPKEIDYSEFDETSFNLGAKWKSERSYSEEEVKDMLFEVLNHKKEECCVTDTTDSIVRKVIKQFKKK